MPLVRLLLLCASASLAPAVGQTPPPLSIAAASDLQPVLPALAERFERQTGQAVRVSFGSSGNFFAQIENGAPFDLFFSADIDYPRRLDASGLTEAGTLVEYALGRIVLWTRNDTELDLTRGLAVLTDARVHRIALANPEHAPYGRAAVAALRHERLYDQVRGKFVLGENISQAAQFAQSGNAEVGLIALSLARTSTMRESGHSHEIPPTWYPPLEQGAVVLRASRQKDAARQFLLFLQQPESRRTLEDAGFVVPSRGR